MACYKQSNFVIFGGFNKTFAFASANYLPNSAQAYRAMRNMPRTGGIFLAYLDSYPLLS
jgi:hypothetical protein